MKSKTVITWLRFGRKKTYLWQILAVLAWDYFYSSGMKRERAKINFLTTLWKLDTPKIIELMNELLW